MTTRNDVQLWIKVMDTSTMTGTYLDSLPVRSHKHPFDCHSICRALAFYIPELKYVDGRVAGMKLDKASGQFTEYEFCRHSWLVTPDKAIIDPYPVGVFASNALLIPLDHGVYNSWGSDLYLPDPAVTTFVSGPKLLRRSNVLLRHIYEAEEQNRKAAA